MGKAKPVVVVDNDAEEAEAVQYKVTAGELRQFIERWEKLAAEKAELTEDQKEVMAEAKARGYQPKIMRRLISIRKRDAAEVSEEEAMLELYKQALGM